MLGDLATDDDPSWAADTRATMKAKGSMQGKKGIIVYSLKDIWIFRYSNKKIITFSDEILEITDMR
jgi:hypothetical protein